MKAPSFRGPHPGPLPEHTAAHLAALAPKSSRKQEVQDARLAAEGLFALVNRTASVVSPVDVIAGAILEYAQLYAEHEKECVFREAKARTKGEVAALRRALTAFDAALTNIEAQGG